MVKRWEDIEGVLFYQNLPYMLKIIHIELINYHYDDSLAGHFEINKI